MPRYYCYLIGLISFIASLSAQAMRCGVNLVTTGDNQYNVLQKCGEPKDKQIYTQEIPLYNSAGYQIGTTTNTEERWIYQKSPQEFQYTILFDSGIIKDIKTDRNPY